MTHRVPGECSERACASGTRPGTQRRLAISAFTRVFDALWRNIVEQLAVCPWVPALARKSALGRDTLSRG